MRAATARPGEPPRGASVRSLCECGSGLAAVCCCDLDLAAAQPESPAVAALVERALQAQAAGDLVAVERACLAVIDACPMQRDAIRMLMQLHRTGGNLRAAEALLRRLVALDPNDVAAAIDLGLLLLDKGDFVGAEIPARNAVRMAPISPKSHNLLAMVLTESHRPHAGEYHYRRALQLSPARAPILIANLAWNLRNQGRMSEARQLYIECTKAGPPVQQTWLGWARLEEADRQFAAAHHILDQAEVHFPSNPQLLLVRATVFARTGQHDLALRTLERLETLTPDGLGPEALMQKGALLDRLGRYDQAFATFAESKRKVRDTSGESYQAARALDLTQRLKQFFTAQRRSILPQSGVRGDSPQPIFIVGFPRSGTTMVEQILSAHPQISAGDELPLVDELSGAVQRLFASPLSYPESLAELWMAEHCDGLDVLRDHYLHRARQMGAVQPGADWFTDKMPLNETHLGLISLVFPRSPIIHIVRHPADVVLSAFSNHMTHGFCCSVRVGNCCSALHVDHGSRRALSARVGFEVCADSLRTSRAGFEQWHQAYAGIYRHPL